MILKTASKAVRGLVELIIILVAAFALSILIRTFVCEAYQVPTGSMVPTIEEGDRILSERVTLYKGEADVGDIITFDSPTDSSMTLVKRVIAKEGDVVDIHDGCLYVNGFLQEEDYVHDKPTYELENYPSVSIYYPYKVPEGYVWVMGDNRTNSSDSRYFGPIKEDSITGIVFFRFWPFNRFGTM